MTKTDTAPFALPKNITLHMTADDIDGAICNSRSHCAIARNIYRELRVEIDRCRVSTAGVSIAKEGYRYYYRVPKKACALVMHFDKGEKVTPIDSYRLRFTNRTKIQPVNPERKAQVNRARQERVAALHAMGQRPKSYPRGRYGI